MKFEFYFYKILVVILNWEKLMDYFFFLKLNVNYRNKIYWILYIIVELFIFKIVILEGRMIDYVYKLMYLYRYMLILFCVVKIY